jgi:hypothetical protein
MHNANTHAWKLGYIILMRALTQTKVTLACTHAARLHVVYVLNAVTRIRIKRIHTHVHLSHGRHAHQATSKFSSKY